MQRKLQDYIHFYIGQEAEVFWTFQGRVESEGIGIIIGIKTLIDLTQEHPITVRKKIGAHSTDTAEYNYAYEDVKPLLRPLSDMTEEEAIALYCSEPWHHVSKSHIKQAVIKENVKGHQPNIIRFITLDRPGRLAIVLAPTYYILTSCRPCNLHFFFLAALTSSTSLNPA